MLDANKQYRLPKLEVHAYFPSVTPPPSAGPPRRRLCPDCRCTILWHRSKGQLSRGSASFSKCHFPHHQNKTQFL